LIVAGGGAGKTPMAHALAGAGGVEYEVVRYGEPLAGYISDERIGAITLANALFHHADVVVDSVKDLLALAGGGAMKAGISRGALPTLSRWGAIAAQLGATIYVPINPSSADDEVVELLVEAAKSNATCTIYADGENSWRYLSRRGEGLRRDSGSFKVRYNADGVMTINGVEESPSRGEQVHIPASVDLTEDDHANAIRRAINASRNS